MNREDALSTIQQVAAEVLSVETDAVTDASA